MNCTDVICCTRRRSYEGSVHCIGHYSGHQYRVRPMGVRLWAEGQQHDSEIIADNLRIKGTAEKSGVQVVEDGAKVNMNWESYRLRRA